MTSKIFVKDAVGRLGQVAAAAAWLAGAAAVRDLETADLQAEVDGRAVQGPPDVPPRVTAQAAAHGGGTHYRVQALGTRARLRPPPAVLRYAVQPVLKYAVYMFICCLY